jgi:hypothetical protein
MSSFFLFRFLKLHALENCKMILQTVALVFVFSTTLPDAHASACELRLVGSSELNLRAEPKSGTKIISTLSLNSRLCLERPESTATAALLEKWSYVSTELDRDLKGWVQSKYLASEITRDSKASEEAEKALANKDIAGAVKWAERAVEANESPETLKFLIKVYKQAKEEKRLKRAEDRLASLQLSKTSSEEDGEKIAITSAPTRESSPITQELWKKLYCDNQVTAKKRLQEPFESLRLEGLKTAELLFPLNSHLAEEIRTLYKLSDLVLNDDIDECLMSEVPDEDRCGGFAELYPEIKKKVSKELKHKSTAELKERFLAIDNSKAKRGWWKKTKREITERLGPAFDQLLKEAKGVRSPNHQINSASEWDRYWLQSHYFSPKASESMVYADNLKFTVCNYFDLTYSNRQSTDHILGLESLLRLTEHWIAKSQPESGQELIQIILRDYPKAGWVEGNGSFGGSYASQAEKILLRLNCKKEEKKSPQFKSLKGFTETLLNTVRNHNLAQWTELFRCHVLLIESTKSGFTEQSTQLQAVNLINENKDEILKTKPVLHEKERSVSFPHIRFFLDPEGKLVRIAK